MRQPHAEGFLQGICAPWWPGVPPLQGTRYHKPDLGCHATHLHCTIAGHGWITPLRHGGTLLNAAVHTLQAAGRCRHGAGYPPRVRDLTERQH